MNRSEYYSGRNSSYLTTFVEGYVGRRGEDTPEGKNLLQGMETHHDDHFMGPGKEIIILKGNTTPIANLGK